MKRFLRYLILFSLMFTGVIIALFVLLIKINDKLIGDVAIDDSITTVFIGDSHIRQAINPEIFEHSLNLSHNSESFYFSYFKLKKLLNHSNNIHSIYLGVSYNSLSSTYDEYIYGEKSDSNSRKYFYYMPYIEELRLLKWNFYKIIPYLKDLIDHGFNQVYNGYTINTFGEFNNHFYKVNIDIEVVDERIKLQYYKNNKLCDFSYFNLIYLDRIVSLCNSLDIDLYFINTPLHSSYRNKIPIIYINKYDELVDSYNIKTIDIGNNKFNDSDFIPDGDHLSRVGSDKYSHLLKMYFN